MRLELARQLAALPEGLLVTCAGRSMEPAIRLGEQVRVRAVDPWHLRAGEVFLFETAGGELEMHRLVLALPGGWLIHRGDYQAVSGHGVTRVERVLGRVELPARPPDREAIARALAAMAWRAPGALWRRARRRSGTGQAR